MRRMYNRSVPKPTRKAVLEIISRLSALYPSHPLKIDGTTPPFEVLVAAVMSARTKDPVTVEAARRLFAVARTPRDLRKVAADRVAKLIYPVGFYNTKAEALVGLAGVIEDSFGGEVPHTREEMMSLPGVGRKTANLVLSVAFGIPAICVDTHMHRICNRLGWVKTQNVGETEQALMKVLPKEHWATINRLIVNHGQQICAPTSPKCSGCPVADLCPRVGVGKSR
jgi:endonuclease-3